MTKQETLEKIDNYSKYNLVRFVRLEWSVEREGYKPFISIEAQISFSYLLIHLSIHSLNLFIQTMAIDQTMAIVSHQKQLEQFVGAHYMLLRYR